MKHALLTSLLLVVPLSLQAEEPLKRSGPTYLFLGDSITAGGKYIDYVETWYLLNEKEQPTFINLGLSSETVSGLSEAHHPFPRPDLHERLDRIFKAIQPDNVVACYGINDGIYHPFGEDRFEAYQQGVHKLRQKAQAVGAGLILMTPPPYAGAVTNAKEPADGKDFGYKTPYKDYDKVMAKYAEWIRSLDGQQGIRVVEVRKPISQHMDDCYGRDPIHPNGLGHILMAEALLARLGKKTGHDTLKTGKSAMQNNKKWQQVETLVRKRRQTYDKALLQKIGHKRPGVKARFTLDKAIPEAKKIDQQLTNLLNSDE